MIHVAACHLTKPQFFFKLLGCLYLFIQHGEKLKEAGGDVHKLPLPQLSGSMNQSCGVCVLSYFCPLARLPIPPFPNAFLICLLGCDISLDSFCISGICIPGSVTVSSSAPSSLAVSSSVLEATCFVCSALPTHFLWHFLKFIFKQYLCSADTYVDISRIIYVHGSSLWLLGYLLGSSKFKNKLMVLCLPLNITLFESRVFIQRHLILSMSQIPHTMLYSSFSHYIVPPLSSIYIIKLEAVEEPHCHHVSHLDGYKRPLTGFCSLFLQPSCSEHIRQFLLSQPSQPWPTSLTKSLMPLNSSPSSPS